MNLTRKKTIVIGGCGVNGLSLIGSLKYLQENELDTNNMKNYIGTSIGSILCLLLVCEIDMTTLENLIKKNDKIFEMDISKFFEKYGIINSDNLLKIIENILFKKIKKKNVTFEDLYDKTKKNYVVTSTNITKLQSEYFNYTNTPHMLIIDAIKSSICIPLIFEKIQIENSYYCDGALCDMCSFGHALMLDKVENCIILQSYYKGDCEIKDIITYVDAILKTIFCGQLYYVHNNTSLDIIIIESVEGVTLMNYDENVEKLVKHGYNETKRMMKQIKLKVE